MRKIGTKRSLIHAGGDATISPMDNNRRTFAKAATWQLIGFVVMTVVNYFYVGNFKSGLGLSVLLTSIGVVTYYFHERFWARIVWGRLANSDSTTRAEQRHGVGTHP
jgi:uncharacterized membrane protein